MSQTFDLRALAQVLGGEVAGRDWVEVPGPGHSPQDRSLVVKLDSNAQGGFVCYSHAGDDWRDCRKHIMQRLGLHWQDDMPKRNQQAIAKVENDKARRCRMAREIWEAAGDPRDTIAERYLESRGLHLVNDLLGSLRFHPRCPWRDARVPALIAPFRSFADNVVTGVQRVALTADGQKVDRRMFGVTGGAAVKLDPAADTLTVGEGVETCLAARQLGYGPVWALGSAGAIMRLPVLAGVQMLRILGEAGEASRRAVRVCAPRWREAGRRVELVMPRVGSDMNDELMALADLAVQDEA